MRFVASAAVWSTDGAGLVWVKPFYHFLDYRRKRFLGRRLYAKKAVGCHQSHRLKSLGKIEPQQVSLSHPMQHLSSKEQEINLLFHLGKLAWKLNLDTNLTLVYFNQFQDLMGQERSVAQLQFQDLTVRSSTIVAEHLQAQLLQPSPTSASLHLCNQRYFRSGAEDSWAGAFLTSISELSGPLCNF